MERQGEIRPASPLIYCSLCCGLFGSIKHPLFPLFNKCRDLRRRLRIIKAPCLRDLTIPYLYGTKRFVRFGNTPYKENDAFFLGDIFNIVSHAVWSADPSSTISFAECGGIIMSSFP